MSGHNANFWVEIQAYLLPLPTAGEALEGCHTKSIPSPWSWRFRCFVQAADQPTPAASGDILGVFSDMLKVPQTFLPGDLVNAMRNGMGSLRELGVS